jgi:hypothetical protein
VEVSDRLAKSALSGDSLPPSPDVEIGSGGSLSYAEDLSDYQASPIPPGQYQLEATLLRAGGATVSKRVPMEILGLSPTAVLRATDEAMARLDTLVLHARPEPQILFGLGGWPEAAPRALRPLLEPGAPPFTSIALAAEAEPAGPFRWVAWLREGKLSGGMARQHDLKFPFNSQRLALDSPRLLPRAYQFADGRGLFLILGSSGGRPALELIQVRGATPPAKSIVSLEGGLASTPLVAWSRVDQRLRLYWVREEATASQLLELQLDPSASSVSATAVVVCRSAGRIASLRVPPVLTSDDALVEWIEAAPGGSPGVRRLSATGKLENQLIPLPETSHFDLKSVGRWIAPEWGASLLNLIVAADDRDAWILHGGAWSHLPVSLVAGVNAALFPLAGGKLLFGWWPAEGSGLGLIELK